MASDSTVPADLDRLLAEWDGRPLQFRPAEIVVDWERFRAWAQRAAANEADTWAARADRAVVEDVVKAMKAKGVDNDHS